jgi:Flp pilus assembly protein TadD
LKVRSNGNEERIRNKRNETKQTNESSSPFVSYSLFILAHTECFAQSPTLAEATRALYQGEPQRAAELAEKHLGKYPKDTAVRVILARAELAQGKFQRAYQELQKVLALEPGNIDALYYMAIVSRVLSLHWFSTLYPYLAGLQMSGSATMD